MRFRILVFLALALPIYRTHAEDIVRVAVDASFMPALKELTAAYAQQNSARILATPGASETLCRNMRAQTRFYLLLSTDTACPERLERAGLAAPGTRRPYAIGKLVLWTPKRAVKGDLAQTLSESQIRTVIVPNPSATSYGVAAQSAIQQLKLSKKFDIVIGESLETTFQSLLAGRADAGFIARSQLRSYERASGRSLASEVIAIEPDFPAVFERHMVLLRAAENDVTARSFWQFLQSEEAQRLIAAAGYQSPTWIDPNCHGCRR